MSVFHQALSPNFQLSSPRIAHAHSLDDTHPELGRDGAAVVHPGARAAAALASGERSELSKLGDLGVVYFADLFGRKKPTSLRGETTAYLHTSQPVLAQEFLGEFPVLDDYFRYLSDGYASLALLMRLLLSLSSMSAADKPSRLVLLQWRQLLSGCTRPRSAGRSRIWSSVCAIPQIKSHEVHEHHADGQATGAPAQTTEESIFLAWNQTLAARSTRH